MKDYSDDIRPIVDTSEDSDIQTFHTDTYETMDKYYNSDFHKARCDHVKLNRIIEQTFIKKYPNYVQQLTQKANDRITSSSKSDTYPSLGTPQFAVSSPLL